MEEDNHRLNLKEYYKHVKICSGCGLEYGSDADDEVSSNCLICRWKLQTRKRTDE